jgi:hypothetical protein
MLTGQLRAPHTLNALVPSVELQPNAAMSLLLPARGGRQHDKPTQAPTFQPGATAVGLGKALATAAIRLVT